jgi:hypothetical protein
MSEKYQMLKCKSSSALAERFQSDESSSAIHGHHRLGFWNFGGVLAGRLFGNGEIAS